MNLKKITNNKYFLLVVVFLIAVIVLVISFKAESLFEQGRFTRLSVLDRFIGKSLPADAIDIIMARDKYKVGEEIYFAVQNRTDKTLKIENECPEEPMDIYYWRNEEWEHMKATADIICKPGQEDIEIGPYELKASSFMPWEKALFRSPGKYKLKLEIVGYKSYFEKEFEVVE